MADKRYYRSDHEEEEMIVKDFEDTRVKEDPEENGCSGVNHFFNGSQDTQKTHTTLELCEQERRVHGILKEKYNEMKYVLKQKDKLLKEQKQELEDNRHIWSHYENIKNTQEHENSNLRKQVKTLQDLVKELERELDESHMMWEEKLKEQEREREEYSLLQSHEDTDDSLVKAEEKAKNALEHSAQLEHENFLLMEQIKTLQGAEEKFQERLNETNVMWNEKLKVQEREQHDYNALLFLYKHTNDSLVKAEEKAKNALEHSAQLEHENFLLMEQIKTLQGAEEKFQERLNETNVMWNEKLKVQEREQHDYNALLFLYKHTNDSLAEAEERATDALKHSAQLEHENSLLMEQIKTLQGSVQKLEQQLDKTNMMCKEKMEVCEQERRDHSILKEKYNEMKYVVKQKDELLKEQKQELEDDRHIWSHYENIKNTQEHENSNLRKQVKTLQDSVEELERELDESHMMWEEKLKEQEREREEYSLLQSHEDTDDSLVKAEEKAKNALEHSAQLEHENFLLMEQIKTLQGAEEKFQERLNETNVMWNEKLKVQEREQHDYNALLFLYKHTNDSLVEAEGRVKNALEHSAQLEHENLLLTEQVKILQGSVDRFEEQLGETDMTSEETLNLVCTLYDENTVLKNQVKTLQGSVQELERNLDESHRMWDEKLKEQEKEQKNSYWKTFMAFWLKLRKHKVKNEK